MLCTQRAQNGGEAPPLEAPGGEGWLSADRCQPEGLRGEGGAVGVGGQGHGLALQQICWEETQPCPHSLAPPQASDGGSAWGGRERGGCERCRAEWLMEGQRQARGSVLGQEGCWAWLPRTCSTNDAWKQSVFRSGSCEFWGELGVSRGWGEPVHFQKVHPSGHAESGWWSADSDLLGPMVREHTRQSSVL